jgi:hypothetical protein
MIPGTIPMVAGSSVLSNFQIFSSSANFTVPVGVTSLFVVVIGSGGRNGTSTTVGSNDQGYTTYLGGAGGRGGVSVGYLAVTPQSSIAVTIGSDGGSSSFSTMSASGGSNGQNAYSYNINYGDYTGTGYSGGADGADGVGSGGSLFNSSIASESTVDGYITSEVLDNWNNPEVSTSDMDALIADYLLYRSSNESVVWSTSSTFLPGAGGAKTTIYRYGMNGLVLLSWGGLL